MRADEQSFSSRPNSRLSGGDVEGEELPLHRPTRNAQVRAWLGGFEPKAAMPGVRFVLAIAIVAWIAAACSVLGPYARQGAAAGSDVGSEAVP